MAGRQALKKRSRNVWKVAVKKRSRNVWKVAVGSEAAMEPGEPREGYDPLETIPHLHPPPTQLISSRAEIYTQVCDSLRDSRHPSGVTCRHHCPHATRPGQSSPSLLKVATGWLG